MASKLGMLLALALVAAAAAEESEHTPKSHVFILILVSCAVGALFSIWMYMTVAKISLRSGKGMGNATTVPLTDGVGDEAASERVYEIYVAIRDGAKAFMKAEYTVCSIFVVVFTILVFVMTSRVPHVKDGKVDEYVWDYSVGGYTALSYATGAITSMISGYLGMMVAVFSNARTTVGAQNSWTMAFNTAFRAGAVMGFSLCAMGLLLLFVLIQVIASQYDFVSGSADENLENAKHLFECVAGFGLGGSSIALFGRVGGGIYTKAADVGADLAGKVVQDLPEDDPRNPATIADNVGDNVGDVAGMGSDLFGSFAEASCAALVVAGNSRNLVAAGWGAMLFPLSITAMGIFVCMATSFLATHIKPVRKEEDVETVLKTQLFVSCALMVAVMYPIATYFLPDHFEIVIAPNHPEYDPPIIGNTVWDVTPVKAWACVVSGLVGGCIIGFVTEYYTSHSYSPVRDVANSCKTGASTNIIYGLALGYKSAIVPITIIAIDVYLSFRLAGMYGVALAALGMLGTLATCLSIDVYGPVCDNAGGIAEMAELPSEVRDVTDALDAAGNTTAAIGKGFAIGSAALVSLALFGGFVTRVGSITFSDQVNILQPITFAALFIGAMLPYWFTALTMKSVGTAAMEMVNEVKRQFDTIPGLLEGTPGHDPPDHDKCIKISTDASLREMVPPALLVIFSPILCGIFFGVQAVQGLLVGSLTSGVQLAISQSNSGGAWDNAKKYIERGSVSIEVDGVMVQQKKGSEVHKAAVIGDTVGDPLKDTSGPALNILMKLMAIISLVFADFFLSINDGRGVFKM